MDQGGLEKEAEASRKANEADGKESGCAEKVRNTGVHEYRRKKHAVAMDQSGPLTEASHPRARRSCWQASKGLSQANLPGALSSFNTGSACLVDHEGDAQAAPSPMKLVESGKDDGRGGKPKGFVPRSARRSRVAHREGKESQSGKGSSNGRPRRREWKESFANRPLPPKGKEASPFPVLLQPIARVTSLRLRDRRERK